MGEQGYFAFAHWRDREEDPIVPGQRIGRAGNRDFAAQPKGGIGLPLSLEEDGFGLLLQFDWFVENDLAIDARLDIGCARFSGMAEFDGEVNERLVA